MNKNNKLKVICEFQHESHKAVLVELPCDVLDKLEIDQKGYVDTFDFVLACLSQVNIKQKESYSLKQMMFDPSIAIEANCRGK